MEGKRGRGEEGVVYITFDELNNERRFIVLLPTVYDLNPITGL